MLVRLTSAGPAFYSQVRLGRQGRQFRIYKLRTMTYRCESGTGPMWCVKNDSRVTPLGRVLRRLHLDELPQLWNIVRGDMCFIGPRPERPEIVEKLLLDIPNFNDRLALQQGLTGLSQVLQGADTSIDTARRKLRHDLEYGRRESFWLDLRIVVGTAAVILGAPRDWICGVLGLSRPVPTMPSHSAPPLASDWIFDAHHDDRQLCDSSVGAA